jgi:2-dehydro-3-deoxyphosphogluconate aldolase/(4S)-4-hydroxy-2-oxoglutarate aldolase
MNIETKQQQVEATMRLAPVIPVVIIDDAKHAVPMARALVAGGIPAIEVTLRTPAALDAIRAIAAEVEGAVVGVGTVLTAKDLQAAEQAGARFAVSPGVSPNLLAAADDSALPLLPGAATASEVMSLLERGYRHLKFFPAVPAGGAKLIGAWASPLPQVRFCPTGGI